MTITFQTERYLDVLGEARSILDIHWNEIARNRDVVPLNIDHASYAKLDERGQYLIFTARDGGRLIGYLSYFILPQGHLHYLGTPWADSDVFFVLPEARQSGVGAGLLRAAEEHLRARSVRVVHTHVKLEHPAAGRLLEHLDHQPIETIYAKVLD